MLKNLKFLKMKCLNMFVFNRKLTYFDVKNFLFYIFVYKYGWNKKMQTITTRYTKTFCK